MQEKRRPASMAYVYEQLRVAVETLACQQGTTQELLASSYMNCLNRLFSADLPEELRGRFKALSHDLERRYVASADGQGATLDISDEEAKRLAKETLSIFMAVAERDPMKVHAQPEQLKENSTRTAPHPD